MRQTPYIGLGEERLNAVTTENTDEFSRAEFLRARTCKPQSSKLGLASLLLHTAVLAIIIFYGAIPKTPPTLENDSAPSVKSYMFVARKPIQESDNIVAEKIEPLKEKPETLEITKVIETLPEKPKVDVDVTTPTNDTPISKVVEVNEPAGFAQSAPSLNTSDRSRNTLIDQYNQQAMNALAFEAAQAYRKNKLSPNINTTTSVNTWKQPEIAPAVNVDCQNTGKKILASIAGATGGRLRCRDSSEFQKHIDKRLDKK